MFSSHSEKFRRTNYAVKLGERWFVVSRCECGGVHAYWALSSEPNATTPRLNAEKLSGEIRSHMLGSVWLKEESEELVLASANK